MRERLRAVLEREGDDWRHVTDQIGMFCYTGMSKAQVVFMRLLRLLIQ